MAASKEIMKKRRKLASDLRKLHRVLFNYFPTADLQSFESAISELNNKELIPQIPYKSNNYNAWGYSLGRIIFKFQKSPRHTLPDNCKDLKLILDLKAFGKCDNVNCMNDPLDWIEFNIVIEGTKYEGTDKKQLLTSFHLDKHITKGGDGTPEYPHPLYHFQFGGRKLIEQRDIIDTGDLLVFDGPRLAHYPMEAILGIDFVISNFFPEVWQEIRSESSEYINLVEEYQKQILKPYIHTHASQWNYEQDSLTKSEEWNPKLICPQLI